MPGLMEEHRPSRRRVANYMPSSKRPKTDNPHDIPGTLQLKWAVTNREDYHPPLLRQPYGITIKKGLLVTAEGLWPHSRVQILDLYGHPIKTLGQGKVLPYDVTLMADGVVAVTDHKDRTVKAFSQQGPIKFEWPKNKFDWPNGIAHTADERLVVADWSKGKVVICDSNGTEITSFSTRSGAGDEASCPDRVAIDGLGRVIVSDAFTGTVKIFSQSGKMLSEFGKEEGPGCLVTPKGITTNGSNDILVADWDQHAVKMYDASGSWLKDLVTGAGSLRYPFALDWDEEIGCLAVTEHKLNSSPYLKLFGSE